MVLTHEKVVLAFGRNDVGQLGVGDNTNRSVPHRLEAMRHEGVVQIDCGASHSVFRTEADDIFVVGSNASGQLGLGEAGLSTSTRSRQLSGTSATTTFSTRTQLCNIQNPATGSWDVNANFATH